MPLLLDSFEPPLECDPLSLGEFSVCQLPSGILDYRLVVVHRHTHAPSGVSSSGT